jgi:hypothetical protein
MWYERRVRGGGGGGEGKRKTEMQMNEMAKETNK